MLSPFIVNDTPIHLDRFPPAQINRSLQAWDAADELLLNHLSEQAILAEQTHVLVFNDSFGALALALTGYKVTVVSDSYVSHQGIRFNAEQNNLDIDELTIIDSMAELPKDVDIILYKIPKINALLQHQLNAIAQTYSQRVNFIAAARAKDIHKSTLQIFEKSLGETKTSLAVKKARLVFSVIENSGSKEGQKTTWQEPTSKLTLTNLANVFSRESLDIGARFLLEHLPNVGSQQQVIDLGCGNGVLGLAVLAQTADARVTFKDESFMAVASARENVVLNFPALIEQCQFEADDCLAASPKNSADIILCNPPFHQQHAVTDHIAWQMFKDAKRILKVGGELRIIGNRQLGYHVKLKRLFGNCQTISANKKFVILSSIKQ
ncbi:methyltransferase [Thalassotalea euphylliae]|uniref:methyltransferase n=1 Tax=Thalassotalea euphylliae TaxID=1655234 RepID=UPI00363ED900